MQWGKLGRMKILVFGGTIFLGRHIVEAALARGHDVTLFNRGQTNPLLFPEIEKIRGDRSQDLSVLGNGRAWDAVIDTSGYLPHVVQAAANTLQMSIEHYTFISTICVYADFRVQPIDESAPLHTPVQDVDEETDESYGPLKVACERAVEEILRGRSLTIRPGVITGPFDPTTRLTRWFERLAFAGSVLAPTPPNRQLQLIDVRDLANWLINMVEGQRTGIYNTSGPSGLTIQRLLRECQQIVASDARMIWTDEQFLYDAGIDMADLVPVWLPEPNHGTFIVNSDKAISAGLNYRPLVHTIRDTWEWWNTSSKDEDLLTNLAYERESELIRLWKKQQKHNWD